MLCSWGTTIDGSSFGIISAVLVKAEQYKCMAGMTVLIDLQQHWKSHATHATHTRHMQLTRRHRSRAHVLHTYVHDDFGPSVGFR